MQQALAKRYADLFEVFVQHRDVIGRVYILARDGRQPLVQQLPARGRPNYLLLFDRESKPKPAFDAVVFKGNVAPLAADSLRAARRWFRDHPA